ncbi:MAG TPA: sigma-70 family RNA polymerase sigma factor [Thermoleophilaceae bacterium]|nr:sigma-70 family RNA polymerase sigma factor [Thermoleophilaceae bacterium]
MAARIDIDEQLARDVRDGSERAFEVIVARYRRPLLHYCRHMLTREQAEEAVQETFLRAYTGLRRGDVVRQLRPWLYRIARNSSLNVLRAERTCGEGRPEPALGRPPEEMLELQHSLRGLVAGVKSLPPRQRYALVSSELEGRSHAEIAAALGVSAGAVRSLLNRARDGVRGAHRTPSCLFLV